MIAMWIIPFGLSIKFIYTRFILIWLFFTLITIYVTRRATQQPIAPNTPRLVYKWFLLVYKVSYGLAIAGYFIIMSTFLGINNLLLISPQARAKFVCVRSMCVCCLQTALDFGILIMFYGIYYGVLGRDMAESCTDRMASKIGVSTSRTDVCHHCVFSTIRRVAYRNGRSSPICVPSVPIRSWYRTMKRR
jgi:RING finger protein 121/175